MATKLAPVVNFAEVQQRCVGLANQKIASRTLVNSAKKIIYKLLI